MTPTAARPARQHELVLLAGPRAPLRRVACRPTSELRPPELPPPTPVGTLDDDVDPLTPCDVETLIPTSQGLSCVLVWSAA